VPLKYRTGKRKKYEVRSSISVIIKRFAALNFVLQSTGDIYWNRRYCGNQNFRQADYHYQLA